MFPLLKITHLGVEDALLLIFSDVILNGQLLDQVVTNLSKK